MFHFFRLFKFYRVTERKPKDLLRWQRNRPRRPLQHIRTSSSTRGTRPTSPYSSFNPKKSQNVRPKRISSQSDWRKHKVQPILIWLNQHQQSQKWRRGTESLDQSLVLDFSRWTLSSRDKLNKIKPKKKVKILYLASVMVKLYLVEFVVC